MNIHRTRNTFYGTCICPMHAVSNLIIQTSTVQGHSGSKFIENPLMVCCLTSFKSNILYVFSCSRYFMRKSRDLNLGRFKVIHQVTLPINSPGVISYSTQFPISKFSVILNLFETEQLQIRNWVETSQHRRHWHDKIKQFCRRCE